MNGCRTQSGCVIMYVEIVFLVKPEKALLLLMVWVHCVCINVPDTSWRQRPLVTALVPLKCSYRRNLQFPET